MGYGNRDDFSARTRRRLAERASFRCSICGNATIGPSAQSNDAVSTSGRASHICAAAPGGPRFRAMTTEKRSGIENGIWLCAKHGDLIDRDTGTYTVEDLRRLKGLHEERVARQHDGREAAPFGYLWRGSARLAFEAWEAAFQPVLSAWEARRAWEGYSVSIPVELIERCAASAECIRDDLSDCAFQHGLRDPLLQFEAVASDLLSLLAAATPLTNGRSYERIFESRNGVGNFLYLVDVDNLDFTVDRGDWIESEKRVVRELLFHLIAAANRIIVEANDLDIFSPLRPYANPGLSTPPHATAPYLGVEHLRRLAHQAEKY